MLSMAAGCGLVELIVEIVDGLEPLCLESSQCEEGEFCRFDSRGCGVGDKLGECAPRPEACAEIYAPVCGCDGITYPNECQAWAQGARIERDGVCEPALLCGGIAGVPCDDGEYCSFEIGTCGAADQSGLCEAIPVVCTEEYAPVCGCDEATYSNACIAARAEISILRIGECDAGPG
jgi:hypothetical protein